MALCAYLAMRAGKPVTRQHLAQLLRGDTGADQAPINLRQCLAQLRDLTRAAASDALQVALDILRSQGAAASFRVVVVPDSGDPGPDLAVARSVLALHKGPGFVVQVAAYRLFEHWSAPFPGMPRTAWMRRALPRSTG